MLAPIIIVATIAVRSVVNTKLEKSENLPIVPLFVFGFIALAVLRLTNLIPDIFIQTASEGSRWLLLIAIASVGLKTVPKDILNVGLAAVLLLLAETVFLAFLIGFSLKIL